MTSRRSDRDPARAVARVTVALVGLGAPVLLLAGPAAATPPGVERCTVASTVRNAQLESGLTWTAVDDVDVPGTGSAGYVVERRPGTAWYWRHRSLPNTTAWFDDVPGGAGLTPSDYRIRTKNSVNEVGPWVVCAPLAAPAHVTVDSVSGSQTPGVSDVALSWGAVDGATGYVIVRTDETGTEVPLVGSTVTSLVDDAVADGSYTWTVQAEITAPNQAGALISAEGPATVSAATEVVAPRPELRTANTNGRWEVVDPDGATIRWNAVNVRSDELLANPLTQAHVDDLADRFNAIRLGMRWDQVEPADDQPNTALVGEICAVLNHAAAAQTAQGDPVQVILDHTHFGGPSTGSNAGWIPGWAWAQIGGTPSRQSSFPIWSSGAYLGYVDYVMDGSEADCDGPDGPTSLGQHPAVVAIEPMNEPHPLNEFEEGGQTVTVGGAWTNYAQALHMVVYDAIIDRIRSHRPDVPVVLGAFFGGHLYDNAVGAPTNWLNALTTADFSAVAEASGRNGLPPAAPLVVDLPTAHENLIWTAHNYYTGVSADTTCTIVGPCLDERFGPDYDGDGVADPDGMGWRGTLRAGRWTESFDSKGCYGYPQTGSWAGCPERTPDDRREVARIGQRANAWNHDRIAQGGAMPFLMGEWGIAQVLVDLDRGWKGAKQAVCDKLISYRTVRSEAESAADPTLVGHEINWAAWAFDTRVDGGFGLYDPDTGTWQEHSDPLTYPFCRG